MTAIELRILAEATDNPELYEQAAEEYEKIGYEASAQRCRDRAKLYRQPAQETETE